jgi:hypothetical protein
MQGKGSSAKINSLPKSADADYVSPSDEAVLVLTYKQLQDLISPFEKRVIKLERVIELYINPDPRVLDVMHEDYHALSDATKLRTDGAKRYGVRLTDIEERLTDLESSRNANQLKKAAGKKSEERMLKLAITLLNRKNNPMTFSEIGKLLELGSHSADGKKNTREQNMTHFGKRLESARERFIVSPNKITGGKQVHLTKIYFDHLVREYIG